MILYTILSDHSQKTGHYVIDNPNKPAHAEVVDLTRILIIEEGREGVFINRYHADGTWVGDTLHDNIEDAKYQADFEYDGIPIKWVEMPDSVKDPLQFAIEALDKIK